MTAHDAVMAELASMGAPGDMSRYGEAHARLHSDSSTLSGARPPAREVSAEEMKRHREDQWIRLHYRKWFAKDLT
jgi:hypothetical protein